MGYLQRASTKDFTYNLSFLRKKLKQYNEIWISTHTVQTTMNYMFSDLCQKEKRQFFLMGWPLDLLDWMFPIPVDGLTFVNFKQRMGFKDEGL